MSEPLPQRPPVPRPAERAKTIAVRGGPAALIPALGPRVGPGTGATGAHGAGHGSSGHDAAGSGTADPGAHGDDRVRPALWHLHTGDDVSVLLPDDDPLVAPARQGTGELAMTLEITDLAPLPLRQPVRGLLWLTGWLRAVDERSARARALTITEQHPDPRMLDLGHGLTMLRLTPASVVLADAEGSHSLSPVTFDAAQPDPFHTHEHAWLEHLSDSDDADIIGALARHLPEELRGGTVLPLGLDRQGLRLRVETADTDHDVRLPFSRSVETPPHLSSELRALVGRPYPHRDGSGSGHAEGPEADDSDPEGR